ncbi:MAG TPA: hypothetical protein VNE42_06255 [Acidimicrobiales bacterium]|nr:hypothetical protein [Acidimicrobiales bacterium]
MERDQRGIRLRTHMLMRWRGVRSSMWMLWLGGLAVATAGFVALLVLHAGSSATEVPPSLQVQRSGVPLSAAPRTSTSTTPSSVVSAPAVFAPTTSVTTPTVIVVKPRQSVSEGDGTGSSKSDSGSSSAMNATTGSSVADH